jgi:site-specific DNA recombinase
LANKMKEFKRNPGNVAFCYYRYSSDAQRDESIEQQRQAAHEYAKAHGFIIPPGCEFEDRGITGTTADRPGLQFMLHEAKHKRPAYLILWKLDRLSREIHDSFFIDAQLQDSGVQIVTVGEPLPEDNHMRYVIQALYASMAHNFIVNHRSNVMRGQNFNAEKAWYNGVKLLGYSGKPGEKYEIDPDTAPIVKKIFTDYVEGKPLQKIADELNASGLKSVHGNSFVVNSLNKILRNRAYIGEYKWGEHVIPGGMPQIISVELFDAADKKLEKNRRGGRGAARKLNPEETDFWLTGHIYCGECGAPLHGISGTSKTGDIHYYYTCLNHKKKVCKMGNQRKKKIEAIVRYTLDRMLEDSTLRLFIAKLCFDYYEDSKSDDKGAYQESLKSKLRDVEGKLQNFVKAISAGIFNETVQEAMSELEGQKRMLKEQIEAEELREKYDIKLDDIVKFFESFVGNLDDKQLREYVLDIFVDKIYVYRDTMVITFHFTDDKQELSYEDTLEMIENHKYLMDCVNDPETHVVDSPAAAKMMESIISKGGADPDFFP